MIAFVLIVLTTLGVLCELCVLAGRAGRRTGIAPRGQGHWAGGMVMYRSTRSAFPVGYR